jgi:hypothetical protein
MGDSILYICAHAFVDHDNAVAVAFEPEVRFQLAVSIEEDMGRRAVTEVKHIKGVIAEAVGQNPTLYVPFCALLFMLSVCLSVFCRVPGFMSSLEKHSRSNTLDQCSKQCGVKQRRKYAVGGLSSLRFFRARLQLWRIIRRQQTILRSRTSFLGDSRTEG